MDFIPNHVAREYGSDVHPGEDFGCNDDKTKAFSQKMIFIILKLKNFKCRMLNIYLHVSISQKFRNILKNQPVATGNDIFHSRPLVTDWFETVKLNYGTDYAAGRNYFDPRPPLWDKLYRILCYWIDKGVDGFRCDMVNINFIVEMFSPFV